MLIRKMGRVIALALPCLFSAAVVRANNADCLPGGITPAQVRSEGFSEQAQDFVFVCTGGTPAAQGLPIPRFNIELTFNTPVTSRVLAPGALEALLLLNEPTPAQQRVCGTPGDTVDVFGNCTIVATGNGNTEYDGSPGHPNVFQGKVAAPNSIVWPNVPVDFGGFSQATGAVILRMTNLRVNAVALGAGPIAGPPNAVNATITITGTAPLPTVFVSEQPVAFVLNGIDPSVETPAQCAPEAATLPPIPGLTVSQVILHAGKGFAATFKTRTAAPFVDDSTSPAPVNQDELSLNFAPFANTETDFFNSSFPTLRGHNNLALSGLADQGTRIIFRISKVPSGPAPLAPVVVTAPNGIPQGFVARRINTKADGSGPFDPTPGDAAGLAPLVEDGGAWAAVYEILSEAPASLIEALDVPIFQYAPFLNQATATIALAPFGRALTVGHPPIPRFVSPTGPGMPLTPLVCSQ